MTYSLWLCAPWKWKRPFSSSAKPGVEVTISSMARIGTAAGARWMNDLSMSMWEVVVSVSSWAAVGSPITLTDSVTAGSSSWIRTSRGMDVRTIQVLVDRLETLDLDVQLVGIEGNVEEVKGAVAAARGLGLESGDVVAQLDEDGRHRLAVGPGDDARDRGGRSRRQNHGGKRDEQAADEDREGQTLGVRHEFSSFEVGSGPASPEGRAPAAPVEGPPEAGQFEALEENGRSAGAEREAGKRAGGSRTRGDRQEGCEKRHHEAGCGRHSGAALGRAGQTRVVLDVDSRMPVRSLRQRAVVGNHTVATGAADRAGQVFVVMKGGCPRDGGEQKKGRETPRR